MVQQNKACPVSYELKPRVVSETFSIILFYFIFILFILFYFIYLNELLQLVICNTVHPHQIYTIVVAELKI